MIEPAANWYNPMKMHGETGKVVIVNGQFLDPEWAEAI